MCSTISVSEGVEIGKVTLEHCHSEEMIAEVLTKPLTKDTLEIC